MWTKKFQKFFQVAGCLAIGLLAVYGLVMVFGGGSPVWAVGQAIPNLQDSSRVPNVLTYQGMLRQPDGTPLDGTYDMTFRLYADPADAESLRHTEVISPVVVRDGLFTVLLGDTVAIDPAAFAGPLYIGVQVGTGQEMAPRQRIAPVAYAVQLTDGVYVDESGQVGIGTTDPQAQLEVNGDATVSGKTTLNGPVDVGGTLTVNDHLSVTGDISWGGHLNMKVFGPVYVNSSGEGEKTETMVSATNAVCFLTGVVFSELDTGSEWGRCLVQRNEDTNRWEVLAYSELGEDSSSFCNATCLEW